MKKIMIIGAGGIGSFLIPLLSKVGTDRYNITVYDPDIVEEKNLTYQNFRKTEIGNNKALCMQRRYTVVGLPYKVLSGQQLEGYDLVVCCADNLDIRRTMYNSETRILKQSNWHGSCTHIVPSRRRKNYIFASKPILDHSKMKLPPLC